MAATETCREQSGQKHGSESMEFDGDLRVRNHATNPVGTTAKVTRASADLNGPKFPGNRSEDTMGGEVLQEMKELFRKGMYDRQRLDRAPCCRNPPRSAAKARARMGNVRENPRERGKSAPAAPALQDDSDDDDYPYSDSDEDEDDSDDGDVRQEDCGAQQVSHAPRLLLARSRMRAACARATYARAQFALAGERFRVCWGSNAGATAGAQADAVNGRSYAGACSGA